MTKLTILLALAILSSCGKPSSGGGANQPNPNPAQPVVEFKLSSWYTTYRKYIAYEFGMLNFQQLDIPQYRIGSVDGVSCSYTTRLHKAEKINVYYYRVYESSGYSWNSGICAELEGNYWVTLTSDTTATFELDEE